MNLLALGFCLSAMAAVLAIPLLILRARCTPDDVPFFKEMDAAWRDALGEERCSRPAAPPRNRARDSWDAPHA